MSIRPLFPLLLLWACGAGELDRNTVTTLPAGSATGSWASGRYALKFVTTQCEGECPLIQSGFFSFSTCDVGQSDEARVEVVQNDGRLNFDATGSGLLVERGEGGLDEDGRFSVGGYATQAAGDVELTSRMDGNLSRDGTLSATTRTWGYGMADEVRIDCVGTYEVTGSRGPFRN
ncbi:MAG: hypothetical protein IPG45_26610 [Deltaproteobacteria bacterium]|jgi:hypothetical protein|nr:hypothetical protein [Deltaproteobacteria bacterium]